MKSTTPTPEKLSPLLKEISRLHQIALDTPLDPKDTTTIEDITGALWEIAENLEHADRTMKQVIAALKEGGLI